MFYPTKDEYKISKLVEVAKTYIHVFTGMKLKISYLNFNTITSNITADEQKKTVSENTK